MQAVYLENGNLSYRADYPKPKPAAHEALVRVTLCGICSTDLEIVRGYVPGFKGVLGHEFVGVVEEAADASLIGKRVTSTINIVDPRTADQTLPVSKEHHPERTVLGIINHDGVFADYVTVPMDNLVLIPDGLADEMAVFTEPLAAALRIREQVAVRPSGRTAVIGPGRLGMLVGKALSMGGTDVTMLGRSARSLALPQKWGLNTSFVEEAAADSFDFVVEVTGNIAGLEHALRIVRPLGMIVLKSTFAGAPAIDLTKVVVGEVTVVGSRCGPFAPAVRLLAQNAVPVTDMIVAEYPLAEGVKAFEHAAESGVRKILIRP